jgi:hypothetical protein
LRSESAAFGWLLIVGASVLAITLLTLLVRSLT